MLSPEDLTQLLSRWEAGDEEALEQLTPLVYDELRRLARRYMGAERPDHTLEPTALVHEAYLRLIKDSPPHWESRSHFYGIAARLMRRLLVEHARGHQAAKRGGGAVHLSMDLAEPAGLARAAMPARAAELLALDRALDRLQEVDERKALTVELRFFGGLTIEETAQALGVSTATVILDTRFGKAWLVKELRPEEPSSGE